MSHMLILTGVQSLMLTMGPATCRPICNPVQSQTLQVCLASTVSDGLSSRHPESTMERSGCLPLPPVSLFSQVISKVMDQGCRRLTLIAPRWPNMPWFWDLVSLSVQIPFRLPLETDLVTQPFNGLLHRSLSNLNLHAWLLKRASAIQEQGFSDKVSARIEAPQRLSTRAIYKSKWAILSSGVNQTRWTYGHPL